MDSTSIGLDIGSSAVRAAEVSIGREGQILRRFAQVGLPSGAVVDGEVVNPLAVSTALRRLWTEGGFSSAKVVLGVSGHRVIVRQAEVPALDDEDLRSALRFDAQELIPIPMENASFDFSILDRGAGPGADGKTTMRILMVAAHREMLRGHLEALKGAGLEATAIEATPLSLMRVVPSGPATGGGGGGGGVEAIVAVGAELTTVAVRQDGVPQFIRSLAVGGAKLTAGIANSLHVDAQVAERLKRAGVGDGGPRLAQAQRAVSSELRDLAEDVRATVDFFASQSDGAAVERILITGGASLTKGLAEALAGSTVTTIHRIDPFAVLQLDQLGLSDADLARARATAATAVGLALWPAEPESSRLSILPDDVAQARRNRRVTMLVATGVAGFAGLLAVVGGGQYLAVQHVRSQVSSAQQRAAALQANVNVLQAKTAVHSQVAARRSLVVSSLSGDVDWVAVLIALQKDMPPNVVLGSFTSGTSSSGSGSTASQGVATLSFTVQGVGGLPTVSAWLDGLQHDPDLAGTWVQGISVTGNGGTVTFSSTTNLTGHAQSNRAKAVKP
jgi:type IV pilus assembly protein PilM